jgi:hypothetical protein
MPTACASAGGLFCRASRTLDAGFTLRMLIKKETPSPPDSAIERAKGLIIWCAAFAPE